jgi:hypothetical protein
MTTLERVLDRLAFLGNGNLPKEDLDQALGVKK